MEKRKRLGLYAVNLLHILKFLLLIPPALFWVGVFMTFVSEESLHRFTKIAPSIVRIIVLLGASRDRTCGELAAFASAYFKSACL